MEQDPAGIAAKAAFLLDILWKLRYISEEYAACTAVHPCKYIIQKSFAALRRQKEDKMAKKLHNGHNCVTGKIQRLCISGL